ncbi:hypothetical protein TSMEX_009997, partial [Taenia solium]
GRHKINLEINSTEVPSVWLDGSILQGTANKPLSDLDYPSPNLHLIKVKVFVEKKTFSESDVHSIYTSRLTVHQSTERKSSYAGGRLRDCGEPGPLNPPRTEHSSLDKTTWKEESSALRTTPDRKYSASIVRSASTYSPLTYKSSSSVDDSPRGQFLFRTPTATFASGGPGVTRSNTSEYATKTSTNDEERRARTAMTIIQTIKIRLECPYERKTLSRLHCIPKAIYSVRAPFKHNVSTDHLHNRGHPASATATSRSYDFELEHRRTQSADQTLSVIAAKRKQDKARCSPEVEFSQVDAATPLGTPKESGNPD